MARAAAQASRPRFALARLAAGLLGLALVGVSVPGLVSGAALAATVNDGSDWGPSGLLTTNSAVTVSWDNVGNPATSIVPRDGRQVLPHTGGATYDDIDPSVADAYAQTFGPDNGFGGLKVQVSQTQQLVNQSVSISISGSAGGAPPGVPSTSFFQVMQCWGGLTADGKPDPGADQPDPATCQDGAVGPDGLNGERDEQRYVGTDPLALGGDWKQYYGGLAPDVPFTAIDGEQAGSLVENKNQFFNQTTTNELSNVTVDSAGTAHRTFEMQTSVESSGLGCGKRPDAPSTSTCWLVIVPRIFNLMRASGPIAPSIWAQRLQVKLGFLKINLGCPGGQARTLVGGSEMLGGATGSWTPALCDTKNIALGYTQLGDELARTQFAGGVQTAIATTKPVTGVKDAVAVPTALAAPVFAYNLAYEPHCVATDTSTEDQAHTCGYASLAAMQADSKRAGTLVRNLRLDARLVAKLLTQSYVGTYMVASDKPAAPWMIRNNRPAGLLDDPEFLRLNPDLVHEMVGPSAVTNIDHLVVEALRSDAAATVWQWILADPDARAFLNGCPDANGMTINPFYSTRTYVGCAAQRTTLRAQAETDIKQTDKPSTYANVPISYPPDGNPYPVPTWQEYDVPGRVPQTTIDKVPAVDNMALAAHDVAIGYVPQNSQWCDTNLDISCQPPPGTWKDPKARQRSASVGAMAITDAATAARFQLATAQLCDTAGTNCVGADTASLQKAAGRFVSSGVAGVVSPGPADYGSGAYPLTMPVYVEVSTAQPHADKMAYADALSFLITAGQRPGFDPGELPPGYAPLTPALETQAASAIATLSAAPSATPSPPSSTTSPTTGPAQPGAPGTSGGAPTSTTGGGVPGLGGSVGAPPGGGSVPSAPAGPGVPTSSSSAAPGGRQPQLAQMVTVAAGTETWPWFTLPVGLGLALAAGLAGPLLRLRGWIRVSR